MSIEWEKRKRELESMTIKDWMKNTGICTICDLPMRLHPTSRLYKADPKYCTEAIRNSIEEGVTKSIE